MSINSYKDLLVWQKSIRLVKEVYFLTDHFDRSELYGLTNQMRRCAVSIPSNIAEGSRRHSLPEYLRFLNIANGSAAELETQLIIAQDLYAKLDYSSANILLEEILKMLCVLIRQLSKIPKT